MTMFILLDSLKCSFWDFRERVQIETIHDHTRLGLILGLVSDTSSRLLDFQVLSHLGLQRPRLFLLKTPFWGLAQKCPCLVVTHQVHLIDSTSDHKPHLSVLLGEVVGGPVVSVRLVTASDGVVCARRS